MSYRVKPQWGCDVVYHKRSPKYYALRLAPVAAKWAATEERETPLHAALQEVAAFYCDSVAQHALTPSRAHVNAMLGALVDRLSDFRRDWQTAGDRALVARMKPMPCGSRLTYLAWLWFIDTTTQIAAAAQWQSYYADSPAEGLRYQRLESSALAVSMALSLADPRSEKAILYRMPCTLDCNEGVATSISNFSLSILQAAEAAFRSSILRKGADARQEVPVAIYSLAKCYERFVGQRFTHSPYVGSENYVGTPQTRAGEFVRDFFLAIDPDVIDPRLNGHSVATAMAHVVRETRARPSA